MSGYIYFIRCVGGHGPIKVGQSRLLEKRLQGMMHWSPYELEILARVESDRSVYLEKQFHQRYLGFRLHSEWHEPAPIILTDISAIKRGSFDFAELSTPTIAVSNKGNSGPAANALRLEMRKRAWIKAHPLASQGEAA